MFQESLAKVALQKICVRNLINSAVFIYLYIFSSEIHNFRVKIKLPLAAYFKGFVATSKPIKNPVNLRYLLANDSANSPSFSLVKNYALSVA